MLTFKFMCRVDGMPVAHGVAFAGLVAIWMLYFLNTATAANPQQQLSPATTQATDLAFKSDETDGRSISILRTEVPLSEVPLAEQRHEVFDDVKQAYICRVLSAKHGSTEELWSFYDFTHKVFLRHPEGKTTFLAVHLDGEYLFVVFVDDWGCAQVYTIELGHDGKQASLLTTATTWHDSDANGVAVSGALFDGSISNNNLTLILKNYSQSAKIPEKRCVYNAETHSWK